MDFKMKLYTEICFDWANLNDIISFMISMLKIKF